MVDLVLKRDIINQKTPDFRLQTFLYKKLTLAVSSTLLEPTLLSLCNLLPFLVFSLLSKVFGLLSESKLKLWPQLPEA